jgi:hypothetical protein
MNIHLFTAHAFLYRVSNSYRSSASESRGSPSSQSVVAAYHTGPSAQKRCFTCLEACASDKNSCDDFVSGLILWWNQVAGLLLYSDCASSVADCRVRCSTGLGPCCPKTFGPRNLSNLAEGCCDQNEQCVDQNDPNSLHGCYPSDQIICGGRCCATGENFCRAGLFCERQFISDFPNTPPPNPPTDVGTFREKCPMGSERCGNNCCPPGLLGGGRVGCRDLCVA